MQNKDRLKNQANLINFETPETPRKANKTLRQTVVKADNYDKLQKKLHKEINKRTAELDYLEKKRKFFKIGYVNGFNDGKIFYLKTLISVLNSFLEE